MDNCPYCNFIDGQSLDCLMCKKNLLEQELNSIPINQTELSTEYHVEQFHSVGVVL
ncbi:MAG: hypothetical protein QX197_09380 [Methylococcaceae bacterium]